MILPQARQGKIPRQTRFYETLKKANFRAFGYSATSPQVSRQLHLLRDSNPSPARSQWRLRPR